jgi:DNA-binding NarL/FixJ family response regulator
MFREGEMTSKVNLAVVGDSHSLCRLGLVEIVRREVDPFELASAADLTQVIEALRAPASAGLLVLDADLDGLDGLDGVKFLSRRFPGFRIALLGPGARRVSARDALAAGAHGYLAKDGPDVETAAGLRAILAGGSWVFRSREPTAPAPWAAAPGAPPFTDRQKAVLELLPTGKSNKEIGRDLGICEGTVKVHLLAAFRQLGVRNRVEAVSALQGLRQPLLPWNGGRGRRRSDAAAQRTRPAARAAWRC